MCLSKRERTKPKTKVKKLALKKIFETISDTKIYVVVNKQINDKERIAAAMENPNLREMVENCIKEED